MKREEIVRNRRIIKSSRSIERLMYSGLALLTASTIYASVIHGKLSASMYISGGTLGISLIMPILGLRRVRRDRQRKLQLENIPLEENPYSLLD